MYLRRYTKEAQASRYGFQYERLLKVLMIHFNVPANDVLVLSLTAVYNDVNLSLKYKWTY